MTARARPGRRPPRRAAPAGDFRGRACSSWAAATAGSRSASPSDAASVLAFDPDADAVERARRSLPDELAERVAYRVASGKEIELEPHSFDLVVFSWSL